MPVTRRGRLRFEQTEPDSPGDEDAGGEDENGAGEPQPSTSLTDLTTEADPQQFDQTFTAGDADLTIQGRYDPVAGSRQVIPRVAYVINYNLVYNESRDRWEPKKNRDPFPAAGVYAYQVGVPGQTITPGTRTTVTLSATRYDNRNEANLPNNTIDITQDGLYYVSGHVELLDGEDGDGAKVEVADSSGPLVQDEETYSHPSGTTLSWGTDTTGIIELSSGDSVRLRIELTASTDQAIVGDGHSTWLNVVQVG